MKGLFAGLALIVSGPALAIQPGGAAAPLAAGPQAAADPARTAAAERLIALIMPPGTMLRMLLGHMPNAYSMMDTRIGDLDLPPQDEPVDPDMTFGDFMSRMDPHYRERMRIAREVTERMMSEVVPEVEPAFQRAAAALFARRFTAAELEEMRAFFATPAGGKYAELSQTMMQDPALARLMNSVMPRLEAASPSLDARMQAATAHLPMPAGDETVEEVPAPPEEPPPGR